MRQHKKRMMILGIVIAALALFLGLRFSDCRSKNQNWSLVYIPKTIDKTNDFWTSLIAGVNMAAKEYAKYLIRYAELNEEITGSEYYEKWRENSEQK